MITHESRTTSRRPLAVALVTAPLLWLAAEAASPAIKSDTGKQLAVIAAHDTRWYVYSLLLVLGSVAFLPGLAGIAHLVRTRAPRLATVGTALFGYGMVIGACDALSQLVAWQAVAPEADRGQMIALLDRMDNAAGLGIVFATGGISFLVGAVLLSVGLARSGAVPVWSGVAFGGAMVLQLVGYSASSVPLLAASAVVALAAVLPVARTLSDKVQVGEVALR